MHVPLDERTDRWMSAARNDRAAAALLAGDVPHLACFHAQQSVEKALKAVVTRLSGDAPQTHLISRLFEALDGLASPAPSDVRGEGESLDKYYVGPRYPDALGFADAALTYRSRDVEAALVSVDAVLAWARERIVELRAENPDLT